MLDPFLPYLEKRHREGCENAMQLWREIKTMGYPGSRRQVSKWVSLRRKRPASTTPKKYLKNLGASPATSKLEKETANNESLPSVKKLAWLLIRDPDTLSMREVLALMRIRQEPALKEVYSLAQQFVSMVRHRNIALLDPWLDVCQNSELTNLQNFATGIKQDYDVIRAALETPWSNGQTEGQVNRLKMFKRQMYGRANFDLLRRRTLGIEVPAQYPRPP
jgi:transposase